MAINDGRVVSNFIVQALKGLPLKLFGDGSQSRSFCYVSDLIDGIYSTLILDKEISTPINLGNPNEFTVRELANVVLELTNSRSTIVSNPLPLDDPKQRKPDISLANSILNWTPKIQLHDGIGKTITYFRKVI
jgi:UDP-glucuronate decarboxylase